MESNNDNIVENNLDNNPDPNMTPVTQTTETSAVEQPVYSDPNAASSPYTTYDANSTQGTQNVDYSQNTNYDYQQNASQNSNYTYSGDVYASAGGQDQMDTSPMSMGDWVLTILAMLIPCCGGIILYCVWAFGKKGNINRRNYCRAALIFQAAGIVIWLIIFLIWGSAFTAFTSSYYY